jgi:hypothetical protein
MNKRAVAVVTLICLLGGLSYLYYEYRYVTAAVKTGIFTALRASTADVLRDAVSDAALAATTKRDKKDVLVLRQYSAAMMEMSDDRNESFQMGLDDIRRIGDDLALSLSETAEQQAFRRQERSIDRQSRQEQETKLDNAAARQQQRAESFRDTLLPDLTPSQRAQILFDICKGKRQANCDEILKPFAKSLGATKNR